MANNNANVDILSGNDDLFGDLNFDDIAGMTPAVSQPVQPVQQPVVAAPVQTQVKEKVVPMPSVNVQPVTVTDNTPVQGSMGNTISYLTGKTQQEIEALAASGVLKLQAIETEMNELFVEREDVIKNAIRALAIGQHVLLLGPPGTGKSALTEELCRRIGGGTFFQWLLNRTSDPAEILGPYSIKAMEKDMFLRKTQGKLPEAHIAFIDEIYKANEPTLNILLPILNEKIFYNNGKKNPIPLVSLFAASNEGPDDESLKALHDRLMFRMMVDYVRDAGNKAKMHMTYVARRNGTFRPSGYTTISLQELEAMREMASKTKVAKGVYKTFAKLINTLERQSIIISDRRQNECFKIMQGNAVINSRDEVVLDDLQALKSVLWEEIKDIATIETEIDKLINPFDDEVRTIMKKVSELKSNIDNITDKNDKCGAAIESRGKLEEIIKKLDKIIKEAGSNGKDTSEMLKKRDEIVQYNQKLMQEALGLNLAGMDSPF